MEWLFSEPAFQGHADEKSFTLLTNCSIYEPPGVEFVVGGPVLASVGIGFAEAEETAAKAGNERDEEDADDDDDDDGEEEEEDGDNKEDVDGADRGVGAANTGGGTPRLGK